MFSLNLQYQFVFKHIIISFYFGLLESYSETVDLHLILLKVNGKIVIYVTAQMGETPASDWQFLRR